MRFLDIIEKKKNKLALTDEEIQFWIDGVTDGSIPDYQTSSLLMAIVLNGMDERETAKLAEAMMNSGDVIDLSEIEGIKADKHSTGGVGDKTSLALGAMVAACGLKVAKMSGRGLGHTGGTLDKLESIEGFNIFLTEEQFKKQVNEVGLSIIGQTGELVPADKKLYALRDVTATVNSIPLIASSIMSKKLASGSNTILLDVKYGEGAFMQTIEDAKKLATAMISIGNRLGRNTMAMITDMNQPLGNTIGNALEVEEAIQTVQGNGPKDFTELCMCAGEIMLMQGKIANSKEEARKMLKEAILSGKAFEKLLQMVEAQGGNIEQIKNTKLLPQSKFVTEMKSKESGYVENIHSMQLGILAMHLGAGRATKEDSINYAVGVKMNAKKGDKVNIGDVLCTVYHDEELKPEWIDNFYKTFTYSDSKVDPIPIVEEILG
ncbi:pyrimidine-nucleoside phosphorylase [Peptostreptococcus canis]|uniref:Pyrimidine-nucleoside phosphorylase n=1 Tax=Peptostreptococcus canis TaxID=1159213 RepID=A0ABR6TIB6_9FIRM|nr:pyrimidine-nucleoside phosphorylase [Peptostreptococcus canis]MBC2575149.1 pyrimidine-nucleoside phosphorylase [Peptostreptococcus canis]MBP1997677.1 pyrimidine-nucleoside phosphorylase [Peptostreptococcus canis]